MESGKLIQLSECKPVQKLLVKLEVLVSLIFFIEENLQLVEEALVLQICHSLAVLMMARESVIYRLLVVLFEVDLVFEAWWKASKLGVRIVLICD